MAWAVAYMLVLQGVLASVALAALPIGGDGALCLGSTATGGAADHSGTGEAGHVHCPACLARVDTPILPSPPSPLPVERVAIVLRFDACAQTAAPFLARQHPFQPRGPPSVLPV